MSTTHWTREQVALAMHLYCQLPFGKLHQNTPEIIELAQLIGRTPSAVAMKCSNLANLDPLIKQSGRTGLSGASKLDRAVWDEFNADWETLAIECARLLRKLQEEHGQALIDTPGQNIDEEMTSDDDYTGSTRQVLTEQRIRQTFFRRAVLNSYHGRCCMCGTNDARLLIASHIVPWKIDRSNRLNPSNGLCLSALHDRAFDQGLISLADDYTILVSSELTKNVHDTFIAATLGTLHGRQIEMPERFAPSQNFIQYHRTIIFIK